MKLVLLVFVILLIQGIYATCSETGIDINSAQLKELDKLTGIGPVKAQAIIDTRVFDSVNDLIKVYGIGKVTLEKIKQQGFACVNVEEFKEEKENIKEDTQNYSQENLVESFVKKEKDIEEEPIQIIKLNSKDIKTENHEEIEEEPENNYAIISFIGFCFVLGFLFVLKKYKFKKNEFN